MGHLDTQWDLKQDVLCPELVTRKQSVRCWMSEGTLVHHDHQQVYWGSKYRTSYLPVVNMKDNELIIICMEWNNQFDFYFQSLCLD